MVHSLSQRLMGRYFAALLVISGLVSAAVHPLPNMTDMSGLHRSAITATCLVAGVLVWLAPWDRWPRWTLLFLPVIGMGVKTWANSLGGLGPYSYAIHFALIYVWMGLALPRGTPLAFAPLLALAYAVPLLIQGDPRQTASIAMVAPICVVMGESVAWISSRLREVERIDGQHLQRMGWLVEASTALARPCARPELARQVAQLATELPGALGAAVLLPAPDRSFQVVAARSWPGTLPDAFRPAETPVLVEAMRGGETLGQDHPSSAALGRELGVPRLGVAPLFGSTRCMGVVLLARRAGAPPLDPFLRNLVRTLSVQAGLALERMLANEALRDASLQDHLTGLGNRRKAELRLERLAPGDALLLLDLDHFKRVNDTRGHAAGDALLAEFGAFLERTLRQGDEAFRIGGEEFLVVLGQAGDGATLAGERLLESWRLRDPLTTFSGGACVHDGRRSPKQSLARADEALYEAKGAGRDRVMAAA